MGQTPTHGEGRTSRRAFVVGGLGAAAGVASGGLAAAVGVADAADGNLSAGDAAILRFLSAAEILETDLWQQYNELGGIQDGEVPGGSGNPAYTAALAVLDSDMAQYIHDNTEDEHSHFTFLNAYLRARGARAGQPRPLPHAAEQQGDRRPADRPADQPDGADRRHQLVDALSEQPWQPRPRRHLPAGGARPGKGPVPGDPSHQCRSAAEEAPAGNRQHRRLPLRIHRAGRDEPLSVACPAGATTRRCCASCSASAPPRRCISRRGRTRRATHRR